MGESQNKAASTSKAQNKNSMLDEDIGKDFFSSWKSMSMAEDDALDFGSLPKGKNTFNFDKLDMDFSLGGDFDKISSFKGSMPDLDFSSPVKKPAKPKEGNGKEIANGKHEDKQDPFTFSFNFDELDSFDLDSTLSKGQKKTGRSAESTEDKEFDSSSPCDKNQGSKSAGMDSFEGNETKKFPTAKSMSSSKIDLKELDNFDMDSTLLKGEKRSGVCAESEHEKAFNSPHLNEKNQGSKSDLLGGADPDEVNETNKLPTLKSVTTPKFTPLVGGVMSNDSSIDGYPSTSANSGNLNVYHGDISPQKETTTGAKLTQECIQQSERTITTEPVQNTTQHVSICSMSADDSIQEDIQELQTEIGSSDIEVNASGGQQNVNTKPVSPLRSKVVSSFNLKSSPPISITELQGENNGCDKKPENHNLVSLADTNGNESVHGDTDVEDAPTASFAQKAMHHKKLTTENSSSTPNIQLASVHSEPEVRALVRMKEKGTGSMRSHLIGRSQETESHLSTGSNRKKTCLVGDKRAETMSLSAVDDGRSDVSAGDELDGNQKVSTERLHDRPGPKGVPATLRREKNDKDQNTSVCRVQPASLAELKVKYAPLKSINARLSSIAPIKNYKTVSVQRDEVSPLRDCKNTFEDSSLKVSNPILSKNSLAHTSFQREMKSLKSMGGNSGVGVNTTTRIAQSNGAEKHGQSSPSLKRKKPEESEADPSTSYPLKRTTESPDGSRKVFASPKSFDNRSVHSTENLPTSYNSPSTLDFPRDAGYADFEVSLAMENDGVVEKAEACAKELENICNMLKKKHEEAKETLVRAIVNNNNLLMLNHPIYDEKIRMVQRLSTRMKRIELQT